jgi:hypothetical protein
VHSGGYELLGGGTLDLPLGRQVAGVISGFDLGDEIGCHSLGFGPSSSGGAPGVHKEGNIFNLSLLGQYATNFSAGDGLGGTMITDPPASSSVAQTPLVAYHQG